MSTLAEFTIAPLGKGESVSPYVARALAIVRASGLPYRLGPMSTCIEGDWDAVMAVITRCFTDLQQDCGRISVAIKVDYRRGPAERMDAKVASVTGKRARS